MVVKIFTRVQKLIEGLRLCLQTSYTLAWCLYNLARNPEVQEKLRSEVQSIVGSDEMVTPAHIHRMPYLRDCFKESLRWERKVDEEWHMS